MSFSITESVETQLWLQKTCSVNLNYSSKYFSSKYIDKPKLMEAGGIEK